MIPPEPERDARRTPTTTDLKSFEAAALLDLAYDAIFVRGFRDRRITFWNSGAEVTYGYGREEAVGRIPADLLKSAYPIPLEEIEWELLATGRWEGEITHFHRSGRPMTVAGRWALRRTPDGDPIEILEINRDVTAERARERELRDSEERFRLLVDRVMEYAIFMLDPRGYVASWNSGAERIKGYRADEIVGRHLSIFYPEEDVLNGKPQRMLALAAAEGHWEEDGWRVRKDGSRFWANVVLTALRDDRGVLTGYAKVTRDLTERRRREQEVLEAERAQAARFREHAERMEELERTKSNFLNLVSHELRSPLSVLRGYLSMLDEGSLGILNPLGRTVLPILNGKVEEMSTLVNQLLELARLEDGRLLLKRDRIDAREVVDTAVQRLESTASPVHHFDVRLPTTPLAVDGDRERLVTVIGNLVSNAIKYSPEGGRIRVEARRKANQVTISVEDEGLGIEPAQLQQLFTRFGRIVTPATSAIPGTGLGLYLCRQYVELHGGEIDVESEPGVGSRFTVTLPAAS